MAPRAPLAPALPRSLLRFQLCLIRLHGRSLAAEFEFRPRGEVLDVIPDVPRTGQRLTPVHPLTAGKAAGRHKQSAAAQGRSQPRGLRRIHGHKFLVGRAFRQSNPWRQSGRPTAEGLDTSNRSVADPPRSPSRSMRHSRHNRQPCYRPTRTGTFTNPAKNEKQLFFWQHGSACGVPQLDDLRSFLLLDS